MRNQSTKGLRLINSYVIISLDIDENSYKHGPIDCIVRQDLCQANPPRPKAHTTTKQPYKPEESFERALESVRDRLDWWTRHSTPPLRSESPGLFNPSVASARILRSRGDSEGVRQR